MPDDYPMPDFQPDDEVEVEARVHCSGLSRPGPERIQFTIPEGETGKAPWYVAKRWWARKMCSVLTTKPKKPKPKPRLKPKPPELPPASG